MQPLYAIRHRGTEELLVMASLRTSFGSSTIHHTLRLASQNSAAQQENIWVVDDFDTAVYVMTQKNSIGAKYGATPKFPHHTLNYDDLDIVQFAYDRPLVSRIEMKSIITEDFQMDDTGEKFTEAENYIIGSIHPYIGEGHTVTINGKDITESTAHPQHKIKKWQKEAEEISRKLPCEALEVFVDDTHVSIRVKDYPLMIATFYRKHWDALPEGEVKDTVIRCAVDMLQEQLNVAELAKSK
jgi:hypothetical protein